MMDILWSSCSGFRIWQFWQTCSIWADFLIKCMSQFKLLVKLGISPHWSGSKTCISVEIFRIMKYENCLKGCVFLNMPICPWYIVFLGQSQRYVLKKVFYRFIQISTEICNIIQCIVLIYNLNISDEMVHFFNWVSNLQMDLILIPNANIMCQKKKKKI